MAKENIETKISGFIFSSYSAVCSIQYTAKFDISAKISLIPASLWKKVFFLTSHAPENWAIAPWVIPQGSKYAQESWKGSDLPQASEMGHSF